jgi:hypothetical protein
MYRTMLLQPEVTPLTPAVGTDDNRLGTRLRPLFEPRPARGKT